MKDNFRQTMSWLHTWCGLACGWLLCAIFLTGTISVFRDPITRWMEAQPPLAARSGAIEDGAALQHAVDYLAEHAAGARLWRLHLPEGPDGAMLLVWPAATGPGGLQQAAMDPASGNLLPLPWGRQTEGGRHFMSFHYTLHMSMFGFWVVGLISMCMLAALVSGVVVHRRIFKDFFTFRPGKGQRSWLDAHNLTAVLTLPFLLMIVYTGLAIFPTSYMPWPLQAAYGEDKAYARFQAELSEAGPALARPRGGTPAAMHALAPLLRQAAQLTGRPATRVVIERPGDSAMLIRVFARPDDSGASRSLLDAARSVTFNGVTGAVLQVEPASVRAEVSSQDVQGAMKALHLARFAWPIKWLYFLSGLLGTAMIATGAILFSVKRRNKSQQEFGVATARVYRCVDALNVAAIAGSALACIAYLYANRLLPAALPGRADAEIQAFLWVWLASLLHASVRPPARAWVEQFGAAGALCLALPLLNHWTTGQHLGRYLAHGDWQRGGVELTVVGIGLALTWLARRVRRPGHA